ncbi:beta-galactosidase family protein [uncultured Clostridium sp.]|uniref:glycoside hydrolase family 35 protein n=1 Tax=uncultured Clostridium sp. TaxID=59620 RepID=UPI002613A35D|nr:beta-galactosidase family protein [uncultured Clostridium sp.]
MNTFEIKEDFYLNNEKIKIISGSIHYFRVVPEYWQDRLEKLKLMGCNTVETYVPWNFHETHEGKIDFTSKRKNLVHFIKLAEKLGLLVILRPTPYICAEWDFGGLPYWLLKDKNLRIRSNDEKFLSKIDKYFSVLLPLVTPLQMTEGGNIIMMQIENEYGSFSNNKTYLRNMKNLMTRYGVTVPLFTSDGAWQEALESGTLIEDGILPTANFGSRTEEQFGELQKFMDKNNIKAPLMCMEFWIGWFNNYGTDIKKRCPKESAIEFDKMLKMGHSNIYMFHGGTNFDFFNGCSYHDGIDPQTTSYDYDALLTEWGDVTEKYITFKEVIKKYRTVEEFKLSTQIKKINYGKIELSRKVSLFNTLHTISKTIQSDRTLTFEELNSGYGYVLYRLNIEGQRKYEKFKLIGMDDRAQIFANQKHHSTLYKENFIGTNSELILENEGTNTLDILVENLGRINYGGSLLDSKESKGIKGGVMLDIHMHSDIEHYPLNLENIEKVDFSLGYKKNTPAFYEYKFEVSEKGDSFLSTEGLSKGVAFINGFNLGRFWDKGINNYLYIPAPLLKNGENIIIIFETEGRYLNQIELKDTPTYR